MKKADVVVDNLTPGRMAKWGLEYRKLKEINPGIIHLHVSGYGSWGPWAIEIKRGLAPKIGRGPCDRS